MDRGALLMFERGRLIAVVAVGLGRVGIHLSTSVQTVSGRPAGPPPGGRVEAQ